MDDFVKPEPISSDLGFGDSPLLLEGQLDKQGIGIFSNGFPKLIHRGEIGGTHQILVIFIAERN
jgi:hypothetical protein